MLLLGNASSPAVRAAMRVGEIGMICTPAEGRSPADAQVWAADNGCVGAGDPEDTAWLSWLARHAEHADRCLWAIAPDVVGDATATVRRLLPHLRSIRALGDRAALVAHDGLERLTVPWTEFDVLFLGGTTTWKLGPHAASLATHALQLRKHVHMGRVNSAKRFGYARRLGCPSVDGTCLAVAPDTNLQRVRRWIRQPPPDASPPQPAQSTLPRYPARAATAHSRQHQPTLAAPGRRPDGIASQRAAPQHSSAPPTRPLGTRLGVRGTTAPEHATGPPPAPTPRRDGNDRRKGAAMPTQPTAHHTAQTVSQWAATAGRRTTLARRRADAARTVRLRRAAPPEPTDAVHRGSAEAEVPGPIRQRVLRGYHAANLATARQAAEELVRDGCNTGTVPYGYRPQRIGIAPHGRRPRHRVRLVVEPVEASVVGVIFTWRVHDRLSLIEIRRRLAESCYPAPLDPDTGQPGVWTRSAVRAILRNPKYLGRQVWGRRHHGRRAPRAQWVWSDTWAHPPLIDPDTFDAAQRQAHVPQHPSAGHQQTAHAGGVAARAVVRPDRRGVAGPERAVPPASTAGGHDTRAAHGRGGGRPQAVARHRA